MSSMLVALTIILGCVLGELINDPGQNPGLVFFFALVNGAVFGLAFAVGRMAVRCYSDFKGPSRWP